MRMLDQLREHLDEIEEAGDHKAHEFVQSLLIREEEGRLGALSRRQFEWLQDIHNRYVENRNAR